MGFTLDKGRRLVDLEQAHVRTAGDVDQHAAGAVDGNVLQERAGDGLLSRLQGPVVARGRGRAHERESHLLHDRTDVGEVEVDEPGRHDQVGDAPDRLRDHAVRHLEGLQQRRGLAGDAEKPLVRDDHEGIHLVLELPDALLGLLHAPLAFEDEGFGHHAHRERPDLARHAGDDRRAARAGAAAHAGGDEDHVGAREELAETLLVFHRGATAHFRIGAGPEPLGQGVADLDLDLGLAGVQRLAVRVGHDEVHALEAFLDHRIDRVAAAAADTDGLDPSSGIYRVHHFKHGTSSFYQLHYSVRSVGNERRHARRPAVPAFFDQELSTSVLSS